MVILDCWKQPHWLGNQHHSRREPNIVSANLVRSPSPNCHCSCHQLGSFEARQPGASLIGPSAFDQREHIYSTASTRNDNLLSSKQIGLKSVSVLSNVRRRTSYSRESNYCDITDLYECPLDQSHRTNSLSTTSDYYHRLYPINYTKPKNILYLVRINPFKFATMEPLHVDSRLIVFSLLDNFTKLSPNKIFENFIKKLKDEGKRSITIFNLSEPIEHMRESLESPVCEFGWPEKHAPSLEKLCALCKAIDSWLSLDSGRNVAVIYSKRDLSRSSLAIAVFLQYVNICLGEDSTFDYESMQNYYEYNLQQYLQPSQKRYIEYFKGLLSGESKINNQQIYLNYVVIQKVPNFDGNGLCKPFIKIYQGMSLIYSSPIMDIDANYLNSHDLIVFPLEPPLKLRGEILLKCYHKRSNPSARTVMFSVQFHTGTLSTDVVTFTKDNIDIATYDKRFHPETQVELMFNDTKFDSLPHVQYKEDDLIVKWNSYENFFVDDGSLEYTKGPLDGSLYATVSKRSNPQLSIKSVSDEGKLDQLLNEIFLEIESFPDIATSVDDKSKEGILHSERQSPPKIMTHATANSPSSQNDTSPIEVEVIDTANSPDLQLTWLQKQQLKLKNKQGTFQQRRNVMEKQLIAELKHTIKNHKSEPIDEVDGGTGGSPAVPVRTSSKNIMPLFAEQHDLGQSVRTMSLDHSGALLTNGSHYQSVSQYSTLPMLSAPLQRGAKQNGDKQALPGQAFENSETILSPVQRPITPSFPVKDHRHSMLHFSQKDYNSGNVPLFIKDTSSFWYKPHISREEAIKLLHDKPSGTFIIRDSNSFQGAFGLALKVAQSEDPNLSDSVRHFLIESTSKGVQIKGCSEEPVFSSLAALVYQHSITRISLPTTLIIPSADIENDENGSYLLRIYENGAACNVVYYVCEDTESLTGDAAIRKVVDNLLQLRPSQIKPTVVHLKASNKGITLTDNSHKIFFRQHYPLQSISYCFLDPDNRCLIYQEGTEIKSVLFGFVARKKGSTTDNECLIFGQYEPDQPSHAIVDFVNKLMLL